MKALKRLREIASVCVVALVVAALTFGVAHTVLRPSDPKMSLTAGSGFTITSNISATSACSGSTVELYPGTTRYICFNVQNNLTVPISVGSISMALSNSVPAGCKAEDLSLPTFSGTLHVPGSGVASTPGLPIELNDVGDQSPQCENQTLDFTYTGSAQYTDATTTNLASSSPGNTSTSGTSVTFAATVTETNVGQDPSGSLAGGSVTFVRCGAGSTASTCATPTTALGAGTVGSNGQATFATSTLPVGTTYVEAVYGGSGTNVTGSTSNVVTQIVTSGTIATTSSLTSAPNPSTSGSSVTFSDTVSAASGTPTGTVVFDSCGVGSTTSTCAGTKTQLGTGTLAGAKATFATSTLPVGTTYVEAVYAASGNDGGSTSNVVTQIVTSGTIATTSSLTSAPNPSTSGSTVTFSDTVSAASGTPTGTVVFDSCGVGSTTSTCAGTKTQLGAGTLAGAKATFATSTLPVGTTYVEAVYAASGNDGGSTSKVVAQVVNPLATTSSLTSAPNPSTPGSSVTFSDTVSAASGTPTGTVVFDSCGAGSTTSTCAGTKTQLGTGTLAGGKATFATSTLPVGTTYVEAVYAASGNDGGSTSNVVAQVVLNVPSVCAAGSYADIITGTPASSFLSGTNGNDLIFAFGANYWINGFAGSDCIDAGDGNDVIFDGNGNDGVVAGNGSDTVIVGNGNDKVTIGNGSDEVLTGDGTDTVTLGNGSESQVVVGHGNDIVTVGTGSHNEVELGSGTDSVTVQGSHDGVDGGNGNETIFLGSGTYNTYSGQAHHTNVCHLAKPPSSWHGTVAAYYHDTITNCTVVSP